MKSAIKQLAKELRAENPGVARKDPAGEVAVIMKSQWLHDVRAVCRAFKDDPEFHAGRFQSDCGVQGKELRIIE